MALRARNIALEGFAHDFFTPESVAVVGFVGVDEGVSDVTVTIATASPAQVDVATVHIVGQGGAHPRFIHQRRPVAPAIVPVVAVVPVSAQGESPAQVDVVTCHVAPVVAAAVVRKHRAPSRAIRKLEAARLIPVLRVAALSESPAQTDAVRAALLVTTSARGEMPAQADIAGAFVARADWRTREDGRVTATRGDAWRRRRAA